MPKMEIVYTEEQMKAVSSYVENPVAWLQHAWNNKARQRIDAAVEEVSDKNPRKMSEKEKLLIVKNSPLKTRAKRDAEIAAKARKPLPTKPKS